MHLAGQFCIIDKSATAVSQMHSWLMQPVVGAVSLHSVLLCQCFWTGKNVPLEGAGLDRMQGSTAAAAITGYRERLLPVFIVWELPG